MSKKALEIDMIAGSQLRDTQGEMLSVEGADISDLEAGRGRFNDNHGKGFYNSIGRVTSAKKIFKAEDCTTERHKYYWDKVKAPFIYVAGKLYDDQDHPNARAAAAILRNVHKADAPLKIKASVEGGVISRGVSDQSLLARTKIHSVALTFTPANNATLVEPTSLDKSSYDEVADMELIKSVAHLAETDVPSFRYITRDAGANKILANMEQIHDIAGQLGISTENLPFPSKEEIIKSSVEEKIATNVKIIHEMITELNKSVYSGSKTDKFPKALGAMSMDQDSPEVMRHHMGLHQSHALKATDPASKKYHLDQVKQIGDHLASIKKAMTAGYGGAGAPSSMVGGTVIQVESLESPKKKKKNEFSFIKCDECGKEQVFHKHQVKCRDCMKSFPLEKIYKVMDP